MVEAEDDLGEVESVRARANCDRFGETEAEVLELRVRAVELVEVEVVQRVE